MANHPRTNRSGLAPIAILVLTLLASSGCNTTVRRGVRAYDAGQYTAAMDSLREAEQDISEGERPRYALYRGLVHLALGDGASARYWLAKAKASSDADRECFDRRDRGRLMAAWEALGFERGAWGAKVLREHGM